MSVSAASALLTLASKLVPSPMAKPFAPLVARLKEETVSPLPERLRPGPVKAGTAAPPVPAADEAMTAMFATNATRTLLSLMNRMPTGRLSWTMKSGEVPSGNWTTRRYRTISPGTASVRRA